MLALKSSSDTKTSPVVFHRNGWRSNVKNAFGTMPGSAGTCAAEASAACDASKGGYCYVQCAFRYPAVPKLLEYNADIVVRYSTEFEWQELADALYRDMARSAAQQVRAGVRPDRTLYRHNWSGGIVNEWHARAIASAASRAYADHGMPSWIYTRNLSVVPLLIGTPGLRVLASADAENLVSVESAVPAGVQVAYVDPDGKRPQGSARADVRAIVCPATRPGGRAVVETRQSPTGYAGACSQCRACVDTRATPDIIFREH